MPITEFSGLIFLISGLAGFLGALTGLGGGVVVTPVLTLLFGVDIRYAIGAMASSTFRLVPAETGVGTTTTFAST